MHGDEAELSGLVAGGGQGVKEEDEHRWKAVSCEEDVANPRDFNGGGALVDVEAVEEDPEGGEEVQVVEDDGDDLAFNSVSSGLKEGMKSFTRYPRGWLAVGPCYYLTYSHRHPA